MRRIPVNFSLERREIETLARLGDDYGLRKSDIVRMLIRHEARRRGWALEGGNVPGIIEGFDTVVERINEREHPC